MLRMPLVSLYSHVLNGRMWRSTMGYRDDHDARRLRVRTCMGRDRRSRTEVLSGDRDQALREVDGPAYHVQARAVGPLVVGDGFAA